MNEKHLERDQLQQEFVSNESKLARLKHQQERLENRIAYHEKGERKKRTHRLCTIAETMESIDPRIRELTTPEVHELLEYIFDLPDVQNSVHNRVLLHREKFGEDMPIGPVSYERHAD